MGCWGIKKAPITKPSCLFLVFFLNTHIYPYVWFNVTTNNVTKVTWLHSITERSLQCQTANPNLYWNKKSNFLKRGWFFSQLFLNHYMYEFFMIKICSYWHYFLKCFSTHLMFLQFLSLLISLLISFFTDFHLLFPLFHRGSQGLLFTLFSFFLSLSFLNIWLQDLFFTLRLF